MGIKTPSGLKGIWLDSPLIEQIEGDGTIEKTKLNMTRLQDNYNGLLKPGETVALETYEDPNSEANDLINEMYFGLSYVDKEGNIYVSAFYYNSILLDGNTFHTLGESLYSDAILLKLDSKGKLIDYSVFQGEGEDVFMDIEVNKDILFVGGVFLKEITNGTTTYTSDSEHLSSIIFQHQF
jgi:hypothetical protein